MRIYLEQIIPELYSRTVTSNMTYDFSGSPSLTLPTNTNVGNVLLYGAVATKTGSYGPTITGEAILADASSAGFTITLPTAVGKSGFRFTVKKIDSTANTITIATTSAQTIDGVSTKSISTQYQSLDFMSDGANWYLV